MPLLFITQGDCPGLGASALSGRSVCVSAFQGMCFCHRRLFQQMIHSSCQGADDALHFHLEEEGGETGDVDVRFHADDVNLKIIGLGEDIDDELLFGR